jgi:hypothetical protein
VNPLANLPMPIYRRRSRRSIVLRGVLVALLVAALLAGAAIWTNTLGAGERFDHLVERISLIINPPPDRPTAVTVEVPTLRSDPPDDAAPASDELDSLGDASPEPSATAPPSPASSSTPAPPVRRPVNVNIVAPGNRWFASEVTNEMCAAAGVQSVLAILGHGDTSEAFQRELDGRIDEWESYRDSHNGGWGPAAMVKALEAYGAKGYEVKAYGSRADALFDAAVAISKYRKPVILLAWRGAHTWVMTGYRATADPTVFDDARVAGAYIIDPWYPRVSSIWGPSDPPGTYQNPSNMQWNYRKWERPEGHYADRDGKFIAVVPTSKAR